MNSVKLNSDAEQVLQRILSIWPRIMQQSRKEKILFMLSLLMAARKVRLADTALLIEATKLVVPKSYDPFFHMMENMKKFQRLTLDPFDDIKAYNALPIKVKRWKRPSHKKTAMSSSRSVQAREQAVIQTFCLRKRSKGRKRPGRRLKKLCCNA